MSLNIDSSFPGGNIVVERIEGNTIFLHQDLRTTKGEWFYWYFRLRATEVSRLKFHFTRGLALGVRGPAVSLDRGRTWEWLGEESVVGNSFVYAVRQADAEIRFSFAMPYVASNWRTFLESLPQNIFIKQGVLCRSEEGRDVEALIVGPQDTDPLHRIALTCRHHSCEMMPNYSLEGLVGWVLKDPSKDARWLRSHVQMLLVPFMDKDGVENGDQGKNRQPRDHGRDYTGTSLFSSTQALRDFLPEWSDGKLRVCLDLHCPWIAGDLNEEIYLVGRPEAENQCEQKRFSKILEKVKQGPLPFSHLNFLSFGTHWNTNENFTLGECCAGWAYTLPEVLFATSVELPYANAGGVEVNQESARRFGEDLGRALSSYLQKQDAGG